MAVAGDGIRIVVETGAEAGRQFPVGDVFSIGRAPENDLVLTLTTASRKHCRILRRGGSLILEDLGSAHGTLVSGEKVKTREVRVGERIEIGSVVLRLADGVGAAEAPAEATDVLVVRNTAPPGRGPSLAPLRGKGTDPQSAALRLETLLEIGLALQQERETGRLLERTAERLLSTLGADRCGIFLREKSGAAVVLTREGVRIDAPPFSRSLLARAMEKGEALVTADAGRDRRLEGASLAVGTIRSAMVAPLWGRERILGAAVLETFDRAGAFDGEDLRLLVALANLAGTALENASLIEEVRRETVERVVLSRFLSPAVAEEVRRRGLSDNLKGERRAITVLFTDVRNFTSLSEELDPEDLLEGLNRGFSAMIDAVLEENGTIDKFTGDGLLAFFGAPIEQTDHALRAVRSAQAMRSAMRGLATRSGRPIPVGIGISTGEATVGTIGSDRRREYTALGDVVNVAARLVGKAEGDQILATREVVQAAGVAGRSLGGASLKGRTGMIEVFEIE